MHRRLASLLLAVVLLSALGVSAVGAQQIWATGYGTRTCGEAVSLAERDSDYRVLFTNYLQGYITALNYRGGRSPMVSHSLSGETLSQLWLAKCRQASNVTKSFFLIADEIYFELEKSKQ